MALPDDPTKVSLPQMKSAGAGNSPPAAPAGTTGPLASLRSAMQQVANVSNAPAPAPAPLHGPGTGAAILPTLQAADSAMRGAGGAIADAGRAASGFMADSAAQARTAAPANGPYTPSGESLPAMASAGSLANPKNGFNEWMNNSVVPAVGRTVERLSPAYARAAAASDLPATEFDKQHFAKGAPAALPQASYSNEGRVTNADIVMPKPEAAPAPTTAPVATAPTVPANRTPVLDPYSGPAAGMINPNVTPTSGVEDGMRQLQNLRALSDMTPQGGFNTLTDHAAEINAANDKRRSIDAAVEGMNKGGTRAARSGFAQMANTLMAGDTQRDIASGNQQVQLAGQANQAGIAAAGNQVQMRGQTLTNNLGMRQVGATERGQTLQYDTAGKQIAEQGRGHDLQHAAANRQVDATLQGQKTTAETAEKNIQANIGIHEADAAARAKTASQQLGATVQTAEMRALPPGVFSVGGKYFKIDAKTKQPVPFGMPAP